MKYKVVINGNEYTDEDIQSGNIERPLFQDFGIGNVCESSLKIVFREKTNIPRMAPIIPYVLVGENYEKLGTFYIDERSESSGFLSIIAYDSMLKADVVWNPNQSLEFPMPMDDAVEIISNLMGIEVDSRSQISHSYTIDYPANEYTLRNVLSYIAAAHGGNWIITREDKLLLVPLIGFPEETNYLVNEEGSSILFGGDRILV